ncbi:MAG: TlpA family protein disulfide reductase [Gemmatimonadaceae bacterium]|nr:TlpA family protein disulfide reductase [Chitinophagaceae bacterium]
MKKLILLSAALIFSAAMTFAQPAKGSIAPEIILKNTSGVPVALSSLRGKVVLVDFWASWCGPCRRANKSLVSVYAKLKSKGFEIYSISLDDDAAAWKKAIVADKISWLQVHEKGWESTVSAEWKIEQLPTSFLLDKSGKIVAIDPEGRQLEQAVTKLLKE